MKRRLHATQTSLWQWPVAVTRYDRHPQLYEDELVELERLTHSRIDARKRNGEANSRTVLARLVQPISDVLDLTQAHISRNETVRFLLLETQRRASSFWAWSNQQWIETLRRENEPFHQRRNSSRREGRQNLLAVSYLLCGFDDFAEVGRFHRYALAVRVFGQELMAASLKRIEEALHALGYAASIPHANWHNILGEALLLNRSPLIDELTYEVFERVRRNNSTPPAARGSVALSRALHSLGLISQPLPPARRVSPKYNHYELGSQVAQDWVRWCERWQQTSTSSERTRNHVYTLLIKVGRWLAHEHPEILSPAQWTRELAAEFVAAVDRMKVGDYLHRDSHYIPAEKKGKPLASNSQVAIITAARVLFRDCQEWGWIKRRFNPIRAIPIPRKLLAQRKPSPRVIADDIWAKLLWAGLNLTAEDLPVCIYRAGKTRRPKEVPWYPLTMVKACAIVWLFAGLRSDEVRRLRVGCVRWQRSNGLAIGTTNSKEVVCLLDVPVNKTGSAFTKPIDRYAGEAIANWERERPVQPTSLDPRTGSLEHLLFMYRGKQIGPHYLNRTVIPMLCRKAGVPLSDARGNITSHRARSTIASQLFNAKEPMTLFELQEWLGHRSVSSTQYYAKITPTKLAQSYKDAGYFERNLRMVKVLIDQEVVRTEAAIRGEPWKYYDLGHGYCTYDFFEQCKHRMMCAKCKFYIPKESSQAQLLEAKTNLQRMRQEIPLREEERAAVEDGLEAVEKLYAKLVDVPTPDGPTPRELSRRVRRELPILTIPAK